MRRFSTGAGVAVGLVVLGLAAGLAALARRPVGVNVLLVTIDTLRADHLGCYGYANARTPAIDALAAEGVLYEDCTAPAPLTLPSHATILTGLLPPRHGLRDNDTPYRLPAAAKRPFRTLAESLQEAGWKTAAFVSASPLSKRWGLDAGFDAYEGSPESDPGSPLLGEREGGETASAALGWLQRRDRSSPFFLWVHLFDPHEPYAAPDAPGLRPDSVEAYDAEIAYADRQVARLLDALRAEGSLDRTIVALCADHGEGLGEHGEATHGFFLHRSTLRVPLLLRAPGTRLPRGQRVKEPVSLADVAPTLLDLANRGIPRVADGRSLLRPGPPSGQYAEGLYGWRTFLWAQGASAREGNRRVIDYGADRREVYDLAADPGETKRVDVTPADAATGAQAWALCRSQPLIPRPSLRDAGAAPDLSGLGYVTGYAPLEILATDDRAAAHPLPDASFLARFLQGQRILARAARGERGADATLDQVAAAREVFELLRKDDPRNPGVAFYIGRTWRQEALSRTDEARTAWQEAARWFQQAGILGFKDSRTVGLMLQCLSQAREWGLALDFARDAEKQGYEGDARYCCLMALAYWNGDKDAAGRPSPTARARFDEWMQRAAARARGTVDEEFIRQTRAACQ